jgi:hypothetical protein
MKKITLFLIMLVFLSCTSAYADRATLKEYKQLKKEQSMVIYVKGMGDGLSLANVALKLKGQSPLYCPPPKLPVSADGYVTILDGYLEKNQHMNKEDILIGVLLLRALEYTFPCPSE